MDLRCLPLLLCCALVGVARPVSAQPAPDGGVPPEARDGGASPEATVAADAGAAEAPQPNPAEDGASASSGVGASEDATSATGASEAAASEAATAEAATGEGPPEAAPSDAATEPAEVADEPDDVSEASEPAEAESAGGAEPSEPAEEGVRLDWGGEYRFRFNMMSDVPLRPLPRTDPAQSGELGQSYWGEQWLRMRATLHLLPELRVVGQADVLRGVAFGDLAIGVHPEALRRDEYGYPGLRLRWLYLEWQTPVGLLRAGQMGFSWGLGMVANDGDTAPVFGDYRYGDLVRRIMFASQPLGRETPFVIAVAADWVAWDLLADFEGRGDVAFQGVLAAYYGTEQDRVGAYGAYRWQENPLGDSLSAGFADVYARGGFEDGIGGRIFGAVEGAYARGTTSYARTVEQPEHVVEQLMGIVQVGRTSPELDVVIEAGYASGDSNGEDALQGRATIDPDHRVGLILFPEVLAAQSARAAHLAQDPALSARPTRGSELLPTNGGVSGAAYLFPYAIYRPLPWLDIRLGAVLAIASADVVDPYAAAALSRSENARGGDASARELGLEVDGAVLLHHPIAEHLVLSGGVEGGILIPGPAFDDATGAGLGPIGLARLRVGLRYR